MTVSTTDAALKAVYSDEADELRRVSRRWFIASQVFMVLAGSPLILAFGGFIVSFFSGSENSFMWAGVSFFAGVMATFMTMLVFCPFAFYCIYRSFKSRRAIEALVANTVKKAHAEKGSDRDQYPVRFRCCAAVW